FPVLPWSTGEPALAGFEYLTVSHAAVLIDEPVHADHVGKRRAGNRGREDVSLRDQKSSLVAAPRMSVNPDVFRIDYSGGDGCFYCGHHAPDCRHSWIIDLVGYVRIENRITVARVNRRVETIGCRPRIL